MAGAPGGSDLHFLIFLAIYMIVIGIVASIFNPGMYFFGEEDYISAEEVGMEQDDPEEEGAWWDPVLDFIGGVVRTVSMIATFLWAGLTLNIPGVPVVIKIVMCSPIWLGMGYIIATYLKFW